MKKGILFILFVTITSISFAQTNKTDDAAIKSIISKQEQHWNKHDWESLCSFYNDDATLINFVGQHWKSRIEILQHFKELSACCLEPTSLKFEVEKIRYLTSEIAIVYIKETLFADRDYSVPFREYKKGDVDLKMRVDVFVKKNGSWKIASTQMTLINPIIAKIESSAKPN